MRVEKQKQDFLIRQAVGEERLQKRARDKEENDLLHQQELAEKEAYRHDVVRKMEQIEDRKKM